jgi:DNA replicative helicase MCM subunit Mcm2 (Cdc46/Mcm family)
MPVTGKVTAKKYMCQDCGHESTHTTNHFGEFYDKCPKCSWKTPADPIKVHECLEPLPAGWEKPEPWQVVKLGDLVKSDVMAVRVIQQALNDAAAELGE